LFPHLTVLANLTFGLDRPKSAEATARARGVLRRIGLAERERDYPHRLSGGEQQRVALARALLPRPKILLMDEPFSNLDRRTRDSIRGETSAALRDTAATAILVTHDPDDATRMADRILLMHAGRIAEAGTAEDLHHRPASLLAARFFSDFNEIAGVCHNGVVTTALGRFPADGLADGADAIVCIRPRDLALDPAGVIHGRVLSVASHGDARLLTVTVEGFPANLTVAAPRGGAPAIGEPVAISIAGTGPLVFSAK